MSVDAISTTANNVELMGSVEQQNFILSFIQFGIMVVAGLVLIIAIIVCAKSFLKYLDLLQIKLNQDMELHDLEKSNKRAGTAYNDELLSTIRTLITQMAVLSYNEYKDEHDMGKITREMTEVFITDVAKLVNDSLNRENIIFDLTLYKEEFIDKYIVKTTIAVCKELVERGIAQANEEKLRNQ